MARRSSQDPSDPYREFWEHPGRSSRRSGRRAGTRRADRTGRSGERPARPRPRSDLRSDPRPGLRPEPRAPFDPRAPQDPRARDRRPSSDPRAAPAFHPDRTAGTTPEARADRTAGADPGAWLSYLAGTDLGSRTEDHATGTGRGAWPGRTTGADFRAGTGYDPAANGVRTDNADQMADQPADQTGHAARAGRAAGAGLNGRAGSGMAAGDGLERGSRGRAGAGPGRGFGGRPQVDARTAFGQDEARSRRSPARSRAAGRRRERPGRGGTAGIPGYPRRSADGLTIGSVAVVFVVGLCTLAAVENSLLTGGFADTADDARAAGVDASASARPGRGPRRPQRPPQPPVQTLDDRVNELTLRLRGPAARRSYGGDRPPLSGAIRFSRDRTWALGTTAIPVPPDREAMPQVALYVAQWTGNGWRIALSGTEEFGRLLAGVPAQMMPADERRTLARYNTATAQPAGAAGLMLPWKPGQTWTMTATPLGGRDGQAARPLGAVAFRGGDGRVLAAGAGRIYRFCATGDGRGLVMVIHPDGLATTYYHLTGLPRVRDGDTVARGDLLGRIGTDRPCGGAPADRPQVQFGLRSGGDDLPFEGVSLGGWTFRERARPLVGWAERGLLQILPGGLLRNFGPDAPPDPAPEEDGTGRPGPPDLDPPGPPGSGAQDRPPTKNQESDASGAPQQ